MPHERDVPSVRAGHRYPAVQGLSESGGEPMTPAEVLLKAADRVQFGGWTQYRYAADAQGHNVGFFSPAAVQWCAKGALKAESPRGFGKAARCLEAHLGTMNTVWGTDLRIWNDTEGRTVGEVADTMRRVAKELENSVQ